MRTRVAFRRRWYTTAFALCLACAATVAALALGNSSARVTRPAPQPDAPAPVTGVVLESVAADEIGNALVTFRNVSDKPVAAIGYGRVSGSVISDASVIAVPGPIPPGGTFVRRTSAEVPAKYSIQSVIYQDGTAEGGGPLARSMAEDYNAALRALRSMARAGRDAAALDAALKDEERKYGPMAWAGRPDVEEAGEKGGIGAETVRARLMKIGDREARLATLREAAALFQPARPVRVKK